MGFDGTWTRLIRGQRAYGRSVMTHDRRRARREHPDDLQLLRGRDARMNRIGLVRVRNVELVLDQIWKGEMRSLVNPPALRARLQV